ncbi:MAG: flagellar hook-basal body complex protein FliE [Ruminococcaceae bacterium]|nr:flagellar hook-basal body complex protein FliE [Oscillospiraceae bacterium]
MSDFIVPLGNLPTISSITDIQGRQGAQGGAVQNMPFSDILQNAFTDLVTTQAESSAQTYSLAMGGTDDLHTGAIAAVKYGTAVSYASSLTRAAISAYNELMRMQV